MQKITKATKEALQSDRWLNVALETVQELLKLNHLDIDEVDLVRALIRWGKFQVQKDGEDPEEAEKLRVKILPALKLIRLVGMCNEDVVKVCTEELGSVLSADEKLQIMQSCLLKNKKLLPLNLSENPARSKEVPVALRLVHMIKLPYKKYKQIGNYENKPFSFRMEFCVDQDMILVGLNLKAGTDKSAQFFFTVFESNSGKLLACGDCDTFLDHNSGRCFKVSPEIMLQSLSSISIQFTFPLRRYQPGLPGIKGSYHFAPRKLTSTLSSTTITLTSGMPLFFQLKSLVFDGPPKG